MKNKSKNEISIMERLSEIITLKINRYLNKEGLELQKMKLGFEILLINISKFFIIFLIATKFNLLKESLLMTFVFASVRRSAFGLHAKSSIICTLTCITLFVFGAHLSYYLNFTNYIVISIFTLVNILLYKYAPGDTEYHPLLGEKLRYKLKKDSVITGIVWMVLALIVPNSVIKTLITLSTVFEVITILPITYKILNRGYRNYEKYERELI